MSEEYKDSFSEAEKELQDKSPFVCVSCGHPHDIEKIRKQVSTKTDPAYHDEFSEAVEEEAETTAFKCESCGHSQVVSKQA